MIARIRGFFDLPKLSNESQKRLACLLNPILWGGFALTAICALGNVLFSKENITHIRIEYPLLIVHILGIILLRRKLIRLTAFLYTASLWLILLTANTLHSGVSGSGIASLLTVTLLAGVLLGPKMGIYFGGFSIAGITAIAYFQNRGVLPLIPLASNVWLDALVIIANISLISLVGWLASKSLIQSIGEARSSQSLLMQSSNRLEVAAEIGMIAASISDLDELLQSFTTVLARRFNLYHVSILAIDQERKNIVLKAESNLHGKKLIPDGLSIPVHATSIVANTARTRKSYLASDVSQDPFYLHNPDLPEVKSELAIPIIAGEQLFGVLDVLSNAEAPLSWDEANVLQVMTNQVGTAVQNVKLQNATQRHMSELEALTAISTAGIEATSEDELIERATQVVGESLFPNNFGVLLIDYDSGNLIHHRSYAESQSETPEAIPLGEGITGLVALSGQAMCIRDVSEEPKYISVDSSAHSELCVPIMIGSRVLGVLNVESHEVNAFNQVDEHLLETLAGQLAISLEKISLLSEARRQAKELSESLTQLERSNQLKNEFIQNVSHEFRTPLAIVSGYAEMLNSSEFGELPKDCQQPVSIIARRVNLLAKLVDDLTSILEVQGREQSFEIIYLNKLIETVLTNLREDASRKGLSMRTELDPDASPILGEPTFVAKAVDNLLSNAIKFTPPEGIITLRLSSDDESVFIEVEDSGIGIPSSEKEHIFERFYQVDGSSTRQYGGTGMGLALVREIAELHDGEVKVFSRVGNGSRFVLKLPAYSRSVQ